MSMVVYKLMCDPAYSYMGVYELACVYEWVRMHVECGSECMWAYLWEWILGFVWSWSYVVL